MEKYIVINFFIKMFVLLLLSINDGIKIYILYEYVCMYVLYGKGGGRKEVVAYLKFNSNMKQ